MARGEVYVGGSVGIALTGGDSATATDLIRDADVAMYVAKQGGRGRLALFDTSLREDSARRIEMVSALHRALELDEIEMELQPIVDLGDGRLAGVEALLRWRRAGRVVPPLEFVPLAEEAGLIAEIERFGARRGLPARPAARAPCTASRSPSASTSRRGTRCRATSR